MATTKPVFLRQVAYLATVVACYKCPYQYYYYYYYYSIFKLHTTIELARPLLSIAAAFWLYSVVVRGSRASTALYHCFLDKITVKPLLSEGNYSFTSVTEKVKRKIAHKVSTLPHCKFQDYIADQNTDTLNTRFTVCKLIVKSCCYRRCVEIFSGIGPTARLSLQIISLDQTY